MGSIKAWVLKTFYKDEIAIIEREFSRKVKEIQYDCNKKVKLIEAARSALSEKSQSIVGIEMNKSEEEVLVVQRVYKDDIWFLLYSDRYKAINQHPRIMATYKHPLGGKEHIWIDDILVEDEEIGNGSILMNYFLSYCKTTSAEYISGELSPKDADHFDRSQHYYEKHGFEVTFNDDRTSGGIKYELKNNTTEAGPKGMLRKVYEVRRALDAGAYQAAVALALSLPDICSQVEFPSEDKVGVRYPQWCNKYIDLNDAKVPIKDQDIDFSDNELNEDTIYALRCAVLHSGNDEVLAQKHGQKNLKITDFKLVTPDRNFGYRYGQSGTDVTCEINVKYICDLICDAVEKYYNGYANKTDFDRFDLMDS